MSGDGVENNEMVLSLVVKVVMSYRVRVVKGVSDA